MSKSHLQPAIARKKQAIESLLSKKVLKVVIASPTLAQGLNLSAATVIMNSIHRGQEIIKGEEFANVAGRAGRAFVDIDGQVLYPIFEAKASMIDYKLNAWSELIKSAQQRNLTSGIIQLVIQLFHRLAMALGTNDTAKIAEYVFNQTDWDSTVQLNDQRDAERYEEQLRSIDVALLSLVDNLKCDASEIAVALDDALKNSLRSRQLKANATTEIQTVLRAILESRAMHIWGKTTPVQRRGFYFAGIGLKAGLAIDKSLEGLMNLLSAGEMWLQEDNRDIDEACKCIEEFAEAVFEIAPFVPDPFPSEWRQILKGWLTGITLSELQEVSEEANEFIQDGVCYKLTWAVEAVRARATSEDEALDLKGTITTALDVGATGAQEILFLRAGLRSRTLARQIVYALSPSFKGFMDMHHWLSSPEVQDTLQESDWPTAELSAEWHRFVNSSTSSEHIRWSDEKKIVDVEWSQANGSKIGQRVRLHRDPNTNTTHVYDLDLNRIGQLKKHSPRGGGPEVVVIGPKTNQITTDSFGPSA